MRAQGRKVARALQSSMQDHSACGASKFSRPTITRGDRVRQQARHSTSMPDVPLELINEIIGHVAEQGEGLKACTTVAKAWAALAKPLLHQKLSIVHGLEDLEVLKGFIKKIAPWIKHLYVRLNTTSIKSDVGEDIFKTIAEKSNLEHFEFWNVSRVHEFREIQGPAGILTRHRCHIQSCECLEQVS